MPKINSLNFNNNRIDYNSARKYKNTVVYIDPSSGNYFATMKLDSSPNGKTLILYMGSTRINQRRKGIGQYLRAQIIKSAKNAGFNFVSQNSVNLATGNTNKKPPSAIIMEKLGGIRNIGNNYHYTFNLRKPLPEGVTKTLNRTRVNKTL